MIALVNNTGVDIRDFESAIRASIESGAELDDAIADIFAVRKISDDKYAVEFI